MVELLYFDIFTIIKSRELTATQEVETSPVQHTVLVIQQLEPHLPLRRGGQQRLREGVQDRQGGQEGQGLEQGEDGLMQQLVIGHALFQSLYSLYFLVEVEHPPLSQHFLL